MAQTDRARRFLELHRRGEPLLMPNAWDVGSGRLLQAMGFAALATTSSGAAASAGCLDGDLGADATLAHAALIAGSTHLPVSADLENCFAAAEDVDGVVSTARRAVGTGVAGFSIEDFGDGEIYPRELAARRVRAVAEVAHEAGLVLTARAENHLHGQDDLADTIARLQDYQEAGADVLYAPGLTTVEQISAVVSAVDRPVNVLAMHGTLSVPELAELGVARISVGGAFAFAAYDALQRAGRELLDRGTYGFTRRAAAGSAAVKDAFTGR